MFSSLFVNPWMLAGGAAVASPIVVHFFFKARFRPLPWAAMRFLKEAIEQTSRRLKFQEWILLALRCLLILLLAVALARPKKDVTGPVGRGESVDAVLLFDTSYTMGAPAGDMEVEENGQKVPRPVTRMDRAKHAALAILDGLPANSSVQILACADRAEKPCDLGPKSLYDIAAARKIIKGIEPTALATDFLPGLSEALTVCDRGTHAAKEVYFLTDVQKLGFTRQPAIKAKCDEISRKARLVFIRCTTPPDPKKPKAPPPPLTNVAITDIRPLGIIPQARAGVPFVISLKNTGSETVRGVKVGLTVGDGGLEKEPPTAAPKKSGTDVGTTATQLDEIKAGQTATVTLTAVMPAAGPQVLTARLTGDDLPGDNRFDRVILARDTIRVLVVDGTPNPTDPTRSGAHAVRIGLNPTMSTRFLIQPRVVSSGEARGEHLRDNQTALAPHLVVLCNVPVQCTDPGPQPKTSQPRVAPLSSEFVADLAEFVRNGGGLIVACGDRAEWSANADYAKENGRDVRRLFPAYNRVLGSGGAKLLPFDLDTDAENKADSTTPQTPFVAAPESAARPSFLELFRDPPYAQALNEVTATKMFRLKETGSYAVGGQVLLRMTDGRPLVAARMVGEGQVVLVTTTLDLRAGDNPRTGESGVPWGTFAARPKAMIPFLHLTAAHLTARKVPEGAHTAGQPLEWAPRGKVAEFDLIKPARPSDSGPRRVSLGAPKSSEGRIPTLRTTDTWDSGLYYIVPAGERETAGPVFAVNPDLHEAENLDAATDDDLKSWLGHDPTVFQSGAGIQDAVVEQRTRREWTEWLLLALLLLLVVESVWAWICGRSW